MTTLFTSGMMPYETLRQAEAITTAPIPPQVKKTALRRLYESALAQDAKAVLAHPAAVSVLTTVRGGAEGAGIGYLLGRLAGGKHGKYTDLAAGGAALVGLAGSLVPNNPLAQDFLNAGIAGAAIIAYRKGEATERIKSGSTPAAHGSDPNDDPMDQIVQIARRCGLMGPDGQ
jgi:hypothetical protein